MAGVRERNPVVGVPDAVDIRRGNPVELEVEALPAEFPVGTENIFRTVRIAGVLLVKAVDDTVAVEVLVHTVARIYRRRRLREIRIQTLHAVLVDVEVRLLIEPLEDIEEVTVRRAAGLRLIGILGLDFVHVDDLVAGEGHVRIDVVGKVSDVVLPAELHLVTVVVHLAEIHVLRGEGDDARKRIRLDEDARTVLLEDIAGEVETLAEEIEVETDVRLDRRLPGDALVARCAERIVRNAGGALVDTEIVGTRFGPGAFHVHKTGRLAEVVTDLADGRTNLQVVNPRDVLHEFFLGNHPAHRSGREETVTGLAGSEVLGTVVTGAEVEQILVLVAVGQAADEADITAGQVGIVGRIIVPSLVVEEQGADRMLAGEAAAVVDTAFQIPALVVIRARIAPAQGRLAARDDRDQRLVEVRIGNAQTGIVRPGGILVGIVEAAAAGTLLGHLHGGVIAAFDAGAEAFRDKIELLVDGDVHTERGLVLVSVARPVVILPSVPLGQTGRQGAGGHAGEDFVTDDAGARNRMGPEHRQGPDVVAVRIRGMRVTDDATYVEVHVRGLGQLEVQVRTVVVPVVGVVVVVVDAGDALEQTVLEHVAEGNEVTDLVGTAGDVDVVLML